MNGLQLLDKIKETENKMLHLHKAIDKVSDEPDFKESVTVLNVVVKDYQQQLEKMKQMLQKTEFTLNAHSGQERQQPHSQEFH